VEVVAVDESVAVISPHNLSDILALYLCFSCYWFFFGFSLFH
jgi:hypothetical protein